jgi:hypothetical protein
MLDLQPAGLGQNKDNEQQEEDRPIKKRRLAANRHQLPAMLQHHQR